MRGNTLIRKSPKKFILAILTFLFLCALLFILNKKKKNSIDENGVETNAIITRVIDNNYIVNQKDKTRLNNYRVEYAFKTETDSIDGIYEILYYDYSNYFDGSIGVNDTIRIVYDKTNPKNNKIKTIR